MVYNGRNYIGIGRIDMEEYILFLDETQKTPDNPYFCLGGYICSKSNYEHKIIPGIYNIKQKYDISQNIPLHYTDIKNAKNGFEFIKETVGLRTQIMNSIVSLINSLDIITIGVYLHHKQFQNIYGKKLYDIAFFELLRNYTYFLKEKKVFGSICIESRSFKENGDLQQVYYSYLKNGNAYFKPDFIEQYLTSISFSIKSDSCSGLELADFMPVAFTRHINNRSDQYALWRTINSKLYKHGTVYERMLGIKELT